MRTREGLRISDFDAAAIRSAPSNSPTRLTVLDSVIADNGSNGVSIEAGASGAARSFNRVTLRDVAVLGNGANGIATEALGATSVSVHVFGSTAARSSRGATTASTTTA